ncbi:hypothetical protein IIV6-T1_010 [Invertebrate iridescent virus 6]|nr:hypothetical protein IIV6-T1_010 [Invertebrate iridescent virus 6]
MSIIIKSVKSSIKIFSVSNFIDVIKFKHRSSNNIHYTLFRSIRGSFNPINNWL